MTDDLCAFAEFLQFAHQDVTVECGDEGTVDLSMDIKSNEDDTVLESNAWKLCDYHARMLLFETSGIPELAPEGPPKTVLILED